jgi:hypothetical protein
MTHASQQKGGTEDVKELDGPDGLDGLIRPVLQGQSATDPCPEADLLAAHYEGELSERERLELNRHISQCARCQAHLALVARSDASAVEPASSRATTTRWNWTLGWAGLAATLVAAVVVWMVASRPASLPQSAATPVTTVADSSPAATNVPSPSVPSPNVPSPSVPSLKRARPVAPVGVPTSDLAKPPAPVKEPKATPLGATSTLSVDRVAERAEQRDNNAAAKAAQSAAAPTPEKDDRDPRRENLQTVTTLAAPAPQAARTFAARSSPATVPVTSSNGQSVWRVEGADIRHSTDGGRTWTGQVVTGTNQLVAGSAPSPTICWMVGRQGLILRYQDMVGWERRQSPEAVDWVSVIALDLDRATVVASDGRRFRTEDGGQTWASETP